MLTLMISIIIDLLFILVIVIQSKENTNLSMQLIDLRKEINRLQSENKSLRETAYSKKYEPIKRHSLSEGERLKMISFIKENRNRCYGRLDTDVYASSISMNNFSDTRLENLYYHVMNSIPYEFENEKSRSSSSDNDRHSHSNNSDYDDYSTNSSSSSYSSHDYSSSSDYGGGYGGSSYSDSSSSCDSGSDGGSW